MSVLGSVLADIGHTWSPLPVEAILHRDLRRNLCGECGETGNCWSNQKRATLRSDIKEWYLFGEDSSIYSSIDGVVCIQPRKAGDSFEGDTT